MNELNEKQRLEAKIKELEKKIHIYSERDWLVTQAYIAQLKKADMQMLDIMESEEIYNQ